MEMTNCFIEKTAFCNLSLRSRAERRFSSINTNSFQGQYKISM